MDVYFVMHYFDKKISLFLFGHYIAPCTLVLNSGKKLKSGKSLYCNFCTKMDVSYCNTIKSLYIENASSNMPRGFLICEFNKVLDFYDSYIGSYDTPLVRVFCEILKKTDNTFSKLFYVTFARFALFQLEKNGLIDDADTLKKVFLFIFFEEKILIHDDEFDRYITPYLSAVSSSSLPPVDPVNTPLGKLLYATEDLFISYLNQAVDVEDKRLLNQILSKSHDTLLSFIERKNRRTIF